METIVACSMFTCMCLGEEKPDLLIDFTCDSSRSRPSSAAAPATPRRQSWHGTKSPQAPQPRIYGTQSGLSLHLTSGQNYSRLQAAVRRPLTDKTPHPARPEDPVMTFDTVQEALDWMARSGKWPIKAQHQLCMALIHLLFLCNEF